MQHCIETDGDQVNKTILEGGEFKCLLTWVYGLYGL